MHDSEALSFCFNHIFITNTKFDQLFPATFWAGDFSKYARSVKLGRSGIHYNLDYSAAEELKGVTFSVVGL